MREDHYELYLGFIDFFRLVVFPLSLLNILAVVYVLISHPKLRTRPATTYTCLMAVSNTMHLFFKNFIPNVTCRYSIFTQAFFAMYSPWILICMVTERALLIAYPIEFRGKFNIKRAAVLSIVTLLATLAICTCFVVGIDNTEFADCITQPVYSIMMILLLVLQSFIPAVWIVVCNIVICYNILHNSYMKKANASSSGSYTNSVTKFSVMLAFFFIFLTVPHSVFVLIYRELDVFVLKNAHHYTSMMAIVKQILELVSDLYHCIIITLCAASSRAFRQYAVKKFRTLCPAD